MHIPKTVHVSGQRVQAEDLVGRKSLGLRRDSDIERFLLRTVKDKLEPSEQVLLVGHVEVEVDGRPQSRNGDCDISPNTADRHHTHPSVVVCGIADLEKDFCEDFVG